MPKPPIHVMICDDSSTMRRLIKSVLEQHERIQVVFQAKHGKEALDNIATVKPHLLVIDVEMPIMDGIDTVKAIRRQDRTLPIVMFSSLTSRGAEATLDALRAGANEFAVKPTGSGDIQSAMEHLKTELVPKIIQLVRPKPCFVESNIAATNTRPPSSSQRSSQSTNQPIAACPLMEGSRKFLPQQVKAVAIGVSTGGPKALTDLLNFIPAHFEPPILIAQHMPKVFTRLLAERLTAQTCHSVAEAVDGEDVVPGRIYLAPGDFHMLVNRVGIRVKIKLNQEPPENACRPAVDPLFRSFAECFAHQGVAFVLTGMGQDGMLGSQAIKSRSGKVIVQDQMSSVVWGMPSKVIDTGAADAIMSLEQMAAALMKTQATSAQAY